MWKTGALSLVFISLLAACGSVRDMPSGDSDAAAATTVLITVDVTGGPGGVTLTPSSPTPGASCMTGSCRVPVGGSISVTAIGLIDWFFDGWSGAATAAEASATLTNITEDATITARYINTRMAPCADTPPANGHSTGTSNVPVTYTTAKGWSTPGQCPWSCDAEFCASSAACVAEFVDRISYTAGTASKWFGGDDRANSTRSVGTGQGITPTETVTMNRFGFRLQSAFKFVSTGQSGQQPTVLQLDRRDDGGNVVATYTTALPASFSGGWVFWNTAATTLNSGRPYIFTAFLPDAFTFKVNSATSGDAAAGYAGGSGYSGDVSPGGDLSSWSSWAVHTWDFQFRVQQRNLSCQ
jgi:hypothetical protein